MRIKRIEVQGFKSFCDRTVLQFNQPITAVVGPNGCGKSNIVDAIRWCMGEQSAKHLRGKAMEDVIFAGSDTRGPMGMCEVTLVFDSDGNVPAEFLAYAEIAVTRKLYRDGTSEYFLNKTPCRLRDITEFFLGTGIGAKAYSIIEQGRVGMIVSSRPEDRRLLIEEAAGITKYKVKKKAAEKKMDSTRQNLLRVSDVTAELEKQLASLRRQAQKAERYKQYKAELRELDLVAASQRWLGYAVEERVAGEHVASVTDEQAQLSTKLAAEETRLDTDRLTLVELEDALTQLQQAVYELDNRVKLEQAQAEHDEARARELTSRAGSEQAEATTLIAQRHTMNEQLANLRAELDDLVNAAADDGDVVARQEEVLQVQKGQLSSLQRRSDEARGKIASVKADIARAEQVGRAATRRRDDLATRVGRLAEEQSRVTARTAELTAEIERLNDARATAQTERTELTSTRDQSAARLGELRPLLDRLQRELENVRPELHKRRSRRTSLEEIAAKYEGFAKGTRAIMLAKEPRWNLRGMLADIVRVPPELETAVEAVLGERLGAVVVGSQEAGLDGIDFLKQKGSGRATFLPLNRYADAKPPTLPDELPEDPGLRGKLLARVDCDEDYRPLVEYLFGDALLVDDLLTALDLWRGGTRATYVTLDGEILTREGAVSGGTREQAGASVLQQKREIRELDELVANLERDVAERTEVVESTKAEVEELTATVATLGKQLHQSEIELLSRDKDIARLDEELERHGRRQETVGQEHADLAAQHDEAAREGEESLIAVRNAGDQLVSLEDELSSASREQVAHIEEVDRAQEELTVLRVRSAQAQEKQSGLARALARLSDELTEKETRSQRLLSSAEHAAEEAEELLGVSRARREELIVLTDEKSRRSEELMISRRGHEDRRGQLQTIETQLRQLRSANEDAQRRLQKAELRLHDLRSARAHLEESIVERYRIDIATEVQLYHLRPLQTHTDEARAKELGELIERMGEINLNAIEEYNALDQRFTFLMTQKTDLEQALAQLEEAIARINATSVQRFREVFDLVNARFQELFPRCFRGGNARLVLTDEENLLESGIEIFAQPPGKKNATVELMSGGEKAMTAVALIFAIFLIKPSPFCLLDEVDAPLDEANVGRYNDLIRELTDRSQFIVITHNKRTMQIADTLYGVTMEEPGCSKLVSVNLSALGEGASPADKSKRVAA